MTPDEFDIECRLASLGDGEAFLNLCAAYRDLVAENERLRNVEYSIDVDGLRVGENYVRHLKVRAEAAERVCEEITCKNNHEGSWDEIARLHAAWEATL